MKRSVRKIRNTDLELFSVGFEDLSDEAKRQLRIPLLEAFDKWEKAVLRGRESEDMRIMEWYEAILDLKTIAFNNVPMRIKYYQ